MLGGELGRKIDPMTTVKTKHFLYYNMWTRNVSALLYCHSHSTVQRQTIFRMTYMIDIYTALNIFIPSKPKQILSEHVRSKFQCSNFKFQVRRGRMEDAAKIFGSMLHYLSGSRLDSPLADQGGVMSQSRDLPARKQNPQTTARCKQ